MGGTLCAGDVGETDGLEGGGAGADDGVGRSAVGTEGVGEPFDGEVAMGDEEGVGAEEDATRGLGVVVVGGVAKLVDPGFPFFAGVEIGEEGVEFVVAHPETLVGIAEADVGLLAVDEGILDLELVARGGAELGDTRHLLVVEDEDLVGEGLGGVDMVGDADRVADELGGLGVDGLCEGTAHDGDEGKRE